jgi:YD repeat-containing protein
VFDFDRFGNLYRNAANNPTAGQQNRLPFTSIEDSDINRATNKFTSASGTTYDDAGQVIVDNKFREMRFAYDANGRMVKATKTNQPDAWTVYDALGNRVATTVNDIWQLMIYDAFGKLVAEYGAAPQGTGGVKYIQQDWQGSVRTVSNSNGHITARTDHQAFGEAIGIGTGLRKIEHGYSADKATRQGYGLTGNDSATGQQHAC